MLADNTGSYWLLIDLNGIPSYVKVEQWRLDEKIFWREVFYIFDHH